MHFLVSSGPKGDQFSLFALGALFRLGGRVKSRWHCSFPNGELQPKCICHLGKISVHTVGRSAAPSQETQLRNHGSGWVNRTRFEFVPTDLLLLSTLKSSNMASLLETSPQVPCMLARLDTLLWTRLIPILSDVLKGRYLGEWQCGYR